MRDDLEALIQVLPSLTALTELDVSSNKEVGGVVHPLVSALPVTQMRRLPFNSCYLSNESWPWRCPICARWIFPGVKWLAVTWRSCWMLCSHQSSASSIFAAASSPLMTCNIWKHCEQNSKVNRQSDQLSMGPLPLCSCRVQTGLSLLTSCTGSVLQQLGRRRRLVQSVCSRWSGLSGRRGCQFATFNLCSKLCLKCRRWLDWPCRGGQLTVRRESS
ncbi:uncharacterized protein LOC102082812 [Oreochromis niloticus]|uniref:uncharacterized protein LOC102082812 n=1 Tax=Oreochromis niloticus TaxID=8128 RepID=UPI000904963A|nr:uncharacterized protein LOC102082812 [Oreochromis niloticus]